MKKALFALIAGITISSNVLAADAGSAIASGSPIGMASADGCSLLSEEVTINLSNSVFGAYACNVQDNVIGVATCHPTGRKGNVSVDCNPTLQAADPGFVANCVQTQGQPATTGTATVQGGLAFKASSRGGSVVGDAAANCVTGGNTIAEAQDAAGL